MPKPGYKVVTIKETTHSVIVDVAREVDKTIVDTIELLVNTAKPIVTGQDTQKKDEKAPQEKTSEDPQEEDADTMMRRIMKWVREDNIRRGVDPDTGAKLKK